eukprot:9012429-Pyramimonas_sp.AAC.1
MRSKLLRLLHSSFHRRIRWPSSPCPPPPSSCSRFGSNSGASVVGASFSLDAAATAHLGAGLRQRLESRPCPQLAEARRPEAPRGI